jgi:hypothetical protein
MTSLTSKDLDVNRVVVDVVVIVCCSTHFLVRSVDADSNSSFRFRRGTARSGSRITLSGTLSGTFCAAGFGESLLNREFRRDRDRRW